MTTTEHPFPRRAPIDLKRFTHLRRAYKLYLDETFGCPPPEPIKHLLRAAHFFGAVTGVAFILLCLGTAGICFCRAIKVRIAEELRCLVRHESSES
jgi:hypothetical protein